MGMNNLEINNGSILLLSCYGKDALAYITRQDIENKMLDYHFDQLEEELLENV